MYLRGLATDKVFSLTIERVPHTENVVRPLTFALELSVAEAAEDLFMLRIAGAGLRRSSWSGSRLVLGCRPGCMSGGRGPFRAANQWCVREYKVSTGRSMLLTCAPDLALRRSLPAAENCWRFALFVHGLFAPPEHLCPLEACHPAQQCSDMFVQGTAARLG